MYEVEGQALRSIRHVAETEWKGADRRVVDDEELGRTAAVLNEQLVREMFALWRPRYEIHEVKAHAGTPLYTALCPGEVPYPCIGRRCGVRGGVNWG